MKRADYESMMDSVYVAALALRDAAEQREAGDLGLADFTLEFVKVGVRLNELKLRILQLEDSVE